MKINLAKSYGFCFGVDRAIKVAEKNVIDKNIYSYGQIIHNIKEVNRLKKLGVIPVDNISDIENNSIVIIRSHGVSKDIYNILNDKNCDIKDATCPYVKKIHKLIQKYTNSDNKIILLGKKNHPEIIGAIGWGENIDVYNSLEELKNHIFIDKDYVVLAQTTLREDFFKEACKFILENKKNTKIINTICSATKERQLATIDISKNNEAVIVIGGKNSSNTQKLVELSKKTNDNVYFVQDKDDLLVQNILKHDTIGITAGASTPNWVIEEVLGKLQNENEGVLHMENLSMKEMMEQTTFTAPKRNEIMNGKVVMVKDDAVIVNIGYKADGLLPKSEISNPEDKPLNELFEVNQEIEVLVLKRDNGEGNVLLSSKRLLSRKDWEVLEEKFNNSESIIVHVTEIVKGGLSAYYNDIRAFIPASHIDINFVRDLSKFVDTDIEVKFLDFDRRKNQVVLSRRVLIEEERKEELDIFWNSLEEGQILDGIVRRFTAYGAFVELGPADGLVHITEIKWGKLIRPEDALKLNETAKFKILSFSKEENKISLSHKQVYPDPWLRIEEIVTLNERKDGVVVSLTDFGAFVSLGQGLEGLVHVSQISEDRVEHPSDVLSVGEEVVVKVVGIDPEERRIRLTMKE